MPADRHTERVADSPWVPDGTQPPTPPTVWNDPVSGLVTGASYEQEPFRINVVKPVEPDMSEVRRAVDAVLSGEDEFEAPVIPAPRRQPPAPGDTPGMMPPNPRAGWPYSPAARQIPGLRPRSAPARIQRVRDKRSWGGAGVAGMLAMLAILGVLLTIIVTIIGGLVDTITNLFN